jgi:hypothetical protein
VRCVTGVGKRLTGRTRAYLTQPVRAISDIRSVRGPTSKVMACLSAGSNLRAMCMWGERGGRMKEG